MWETRVQSLGQEDPLEKEMGTHSNILAWRIPWTEKPGRPQSMGSEKVKHDYATNTHIHTHRYPHVILLLKKCNIIGRKVMTNLDSIFKTETLLCQQRSV